MISSAGDAPWRNTTVLGSNFAEAFAKLRAENADDTPVNGSGELRIPRSR
ncbi:hypothetical protein [Halostreptopolyspora alba]